MEEVEHKATFNEKGEVVLKKKSNIEKGKKSRAAGLRFESRVRSHWESKNWAIDKWSNNVDLEKNKISPAKRKYNPFKKVMTIGTGFPDFIGINFIREGIYGVIGIEVKMNGLLNKEEKEKCRWYLKNNVFSQILIAKKGKKRGEIEHIDFEEKWGIN